MTDSFIAPSYFIRTFGCQMNVADSLHYASILEGLGFIKAHSEESCDLLVVNTCSVRAKAEEKAISYLGSIVSNSFKTGSKKNTKRQIIFVGCMATVRGNEILSRFPQVKCIIPATEIDSFEDRIIAALPELIISPSASDKFSQNTILSEEERFQRYLPIIRGCSNRCTYCIVPKARGGTIMSIKPDEIFRQIDILLNQGIKAITLLGQNVCAYGRDFNAKSLINPSSASDQYGFPELLADIRDRFADKGIWFKFLTSHPRDVSESLIDVLASHDSFSKHFHLPLQSGDDLILRRMGRRYSSEQYRSLVNQIRKKIPDMRLTTDLIVGFPEESERAFENTIKMVKEIGFDAAFTFLYSQRKGTPAEKLNDTVPLTEKKRRLQTLIEVQNEITLERAGKHIGQNRKVLVEGLASGSNIIKKSGMMAGRTRENEVVIFPGSPEEAGSFVEVRLARAKLRSFVADRILPFRR